MLELYNHNLQTRQYLYIARLTVSPFYSFFGGKNYNKILLYKTAKISQLTQTGIVVHILTGF